MIVYKLKDNATIIWNRNFLEKNIADDLLDELKKLDYEHPSIKMWNKNIKIPRQQCWMADDNITSVDKTSKKYADLTQKQKQLPWSTNVLKLKTLLEELLDCKFDYVLINKYRNGQDYIGYHHDGEARDANNNIIASISLGETRKFILRHIDWKLKNILPTREEFMLVHGSLIVMKDDTQIKWKHAIMKSTKVKKERINLTFRIC